MNATEARQITIESKDIIEKINVAAFNGLNKITVDNISTAVKEGLTKLGYEVKCCSCGNNESNFNISW